jgi:hypothetical protein
VSSLVLTLSGIAYGQSNLPACQGTDATRWNSCFGSATASNGDKYVGEYKDGKYSGQGTYTFANGDVYVGEFKEDMRHGQGTKYFFGDGQFKGNRYVGDDAPIDDSPYEYEGPPWVSKFFMKTFYGK